MGTNNDKRKEKSSKTCVQDFREDKERTHQLRLVLLNRGLLGGFLGLGFGLAITLVLHVLIINVKGLIDLAAESLLIVEPERNKSQ